MVTFTSRMGRALVDEADHALCEKATGFVTEHGPVNLDLMTACTQGVSSQDNGTNRFIVVLDRIDKGDL